MATQTEDSLARLSDRQRKRIEELEAINKDLLEAAKRLLASRQWEDRLITPEEDSLYAAVVRATGANNGAL